MWLQETMFLEDKTRDGLYLTFGEELYLHPDPPAVARPETTPFSVSAFISLLFRLSQALQTEKEIIIASETPKGLVGEVGWGDLPCRRLWEPSSSLRLDR